MDPYEISQAVGQYGRNELLRSGPYGTRTNPLPSRPVWAMRCANERVQIA